VLACLIVIVWPAAPLWQKLGLEQFCIQGSWPEIKLVSCPQPTPAFMKVTPLPLPTLVGQAPIPIIVDDDGSPDGLIALLYFLRNPLFDVRAATVSYGEAHPDVFAPHLAQLLAGLGRADIPVGVGRAAPLEGNNAFPEPWREASDNFWGISIPDAAGSSELTPAAELIIETVSQSGQPVVVFVSGSHTNLAEALRLAPEIVKNIRAVYVMGGSIHMPGNIESDWSSINNRVAEWNIWVDPLAASEVFASGLPIHLVPLDATRKVVWAQSDIPDWKPSRSPEGALAAGLLQWMLDSWPAESVYIWDLVTAAIATNPAVCPEVSLAVNIRTAPGPEQGQTVVAEGVPNTVACLDPDAGQVKAMAAAILGAGE
jgi:purine nucleosidase/pyrimidine-specific ribonucleoside hydrolase